MRYTILLFIGLFALSCSTTKICCLEEPKYSKDELYIKHTAYSLVYDKAHKQPVWVSYQLLASALKPNFSRTNKYIIDTLITTGTADNADYKYSGYDRGHLAPAADMSWNDTAMAESFYFSNISPQLPGFNRGIWKKLENKVRTWAKTYDCLYIATGAVCSHPAKSIGENSITIPTHFYKTVLIYNDTIQQGIGFMMPHANSKKDVFDYAVSIDSVENMANLDFYYKLPNRKERKIESVYDEIFWKSNIQ